MVVPLLVDVHVWTATARPVRSGPAGRRCRSASRPARAGRRPAGRRRSRTGRRRRTWRRRACTDRGDRPPVAGGRGDDQTGHGAEQQRPCHPGRTSPDNEPLRTSRAPSSSDDVDSTPRLVQGTNQASSQAVPTPTHNTVVAARPVTWQQRWCPSSPRHPEAPVVVARPATQQRVTPSERRCRWRAAITVGGVRPDQEWPDRPNRVRSAGRWRRGRSPNEPFRSNPAPQRDDRARYDLRFAI